MNREQAITMLAAQLESRYLDGMDRMRQLAGQTGAEFTPAEKPDFGARAEALLDAHAVGVAYHAASASLRANPLL